MRLCLLAAVALLGPASARAAGLEAPLPALTDVAYTERFAFEFYVEPSPTLTTLTEGADEVYRYVSVRLGVTYGGRIDVSVEPRSAEPCPVRGGFVLVSEDTSSSLVIYVDKRTDPRELLGVLAHELGHLLHAAGFGEFPSSAGLDEGLASWAAGRYWLRWHRTPSFAASVRTYRRQGSYLRLENTFGLRVYQGPTCLRRRNQLYTEWAAFTDFLIAAHGVRSFKALLASAEVKLELKPGEDRGVLPRYKSVYGLTLAQLGAAWLARLGIG